MFNTGIIGTREYGSRVCGPRGDPRIPRSARILPYRARVRSEIASLVRRTTDPAATMTDNRTQSRPQTLTLHLEQQQPSVHGTAHVLVGDDDLAIQAGIDYLHRLGGGTLQLGAGIFTLRNAVQLRQGVSLCGAGASTVLKKAAGHCSELSKDADWYENQIVVDDPSGFSVGCGIMIAADIPDGKHFGSVLVKDTVIAIEGHTLFLSRRLEQNGWRKDGARATASTAFSLLTAIGERGLNGGSGDSGIRDPVGDLTISSLAVRHLSGRLLFVAIFVLRACGELLSASNLLTTVPAPCSHVSWTATQQRTHSKL